MPQKNVQNLSTDLLICLLEIQTMWVVCFQGSHFFFFNWDSPHPRLNSHYEAWNYNKKSTKNITGYRKSVYKQPTVKRCLLILDLKPLRS